MLLNNTIPLNHISNNSNFGTCQFVQNHAGQPYHTGNHDIYNLTLMDKIKALLPEKKGGYEFTYAPNPTHGGESYLVALSGNDKARADGEYEDLEKVYQEASVLPPLRLNVSV